MIDETQQEVLDKILLHEHQHIACKLNFIDEVTQDIDDELLNESIALINDLLDKPIEDAKKIIITLSSILWTYQKEHWGGLNDFFIRVLSQIGYAPSSIMIDREYDYEHKRYSGVSSLLDQLAITVSQLKCEIAVQERVFLLTEFQKRIWSQIENNKTLGISAPTSAGKSFIIALKAIDLILQQDGSIIYIVPTLSLVSQVSIDFRKLLDSFGLDHYEILNTYNGDSSNTKKIFVLTQEKAIGAFSQEDVPFKDIRLLVADEIQNVERASKEDDQRAKTLYDLLIEFRHTPEVHRIVISGPRIEGIGDLCHSLFGEGTTEEKDKSSPVSSFTYSIEKKGKKYFFNQHVDIKGDSKAIEFSPKSEIPKPEGKVYTDKYYNFMDEFITNLGSDSKNIIFSPTPKQARKTAIALAERLPDVKSDKLDSLIQYFSSTVHKDYNLCDALKKGVAYHHGKIPHHVRRALEKAASEKLINNVVCTTTLMQGVNLPAQNVILRNPNLYIKEFDDPPKLTQYEISNLRGRAGRLLKDFIGRTYILDENSFETQKENETRVFEDEYKKISSGYGTTFNAYKETITADLLENIPPREENRKYGFLLSYIRQMIIRHQDKAKQRFKSVGVELSETDFKEIQSNLIKLEAPLELSIKNRYWDPIDIETLYLKRDSFDLPSSINEFGIAGRLQSLIESLKEVLPNYTKRYFEVAPNLLESTCISAQQWMKEKTLKEILAKPYYDDAEKIETTIERLQNKVSYGLPLLLKPLYDMQLPDKSFLRYIEAGAYRPVTRRLIEYNIPRETAIFLERNYVHDLSVDEHNFDSELKKILKSNFKDFDYWIQIQLEAIISSSSRVDK